MLARQRQRAAVRQSSALASFDYTAPALPADPITCALQWASGDARFTLVVTSVQLSAVAPTLTVSGVPAAPLTGSVSSLTLGVSHSTLVPLAAFINCTGGSESTALFASGALSTTFLYTSPLTVSLDTCSVRWSSGDARYEHSVTSFTSTPQLPTFTVSGIPASFLTGSVTPLQLSVSAQTLSALNATVSCALGSVSVAAFDAAGLSATSFLYTAPTAVLLTAARCATRRR